MGVDSKKPPVVSFSDLGRIDQEITATFGDAEVPPDVSAMIRQEASRLYQANGGNAATAVGDAIRGLTASGAISKEETGLFGWGDGKVVAGQPSAAAAAVTGQPGPAAGGFDAEGNGYDDARARASGMTPAGQDAGENAGHMGSVAAVTPEEQQRYGLPPDSYVILKGRSHPTFDKAVAAEQARGSQVVKKGDRYFSVPTAPAAPAAPAEAVPPAAQRVPGQVYDTPRGKMTWTGTGWIPAGA